MSIAKISSSAYNALVLRENCSLANIMIKPEKRKHLDFAIWKKEVLKDPELKAEYDRLQPEFAVIRARIERGLTQGQLAKKVGTKQSVISRLESGRANPTIAFLKKLAQALNSHLEIKFTPSR